MDPLTSLLSSNKSMAFEPVLSNPKTRTWKPLLSLNPTKDNNETSLALSILGANAFKTQGSTQMIPDGTTGSTVNFLKDTAQAIPRDAAATALTVANRVIPQTSGHSIDPSAMGPLGKIVLGKQPIKGLADTAVDYENKLGGPGLRNTTLAVLGAVVPVGLDFLGLGGEGAALKTAVKISTEEAAVKFLSKGGLPEDMAKMFAPRIVEAGTTKDVKTVLKDIDTELSARRPAQDKVFHGTTSGNLALDENGHVNFGTVKNEVAQFAGDGGKTLEVPLKDLKVRDYPTKADMFDAITKNKSSLLSEGVDLVRAENHAIGINPGRIAEAAGSKVGENFLNKSVAELSIPAVLKPLSEKAAAFSKEEFVTKFEQGLKDQNLTRREVAENTVKEMKKAGISTPAEFYDRAIATPTRVPTEPVVPGAADSRPTLNNLQEAPPSGGPQTTLAINQPALAEVKHIPQENARPFEQAVGIGAQSTKEPTLFKQVTTKLAKGLTSVTEYVQDAEVRVRKLLEDPGVKVTDASNAYQKMTLYPGRVATKIEAARAEMETVANSLLEVADNTGKDVAEIRTEVNEYLQATHAPERNAALGEGAAGITNEEALSVLKKIEESPSGKAVRKIAEQVRNLNDQGLTLLKDAGVISDEFFNNLKTKYPNHVPLNRIFDGDEIQGALSVRGFDVRSTGIKRAKGSEREVADIIANVQHNYEQAALRSEKNIVDQATLSFVRDNREALDGLMEVRKPKAIGQTFDNKVLMEHTNDPSYLQLYEDGKPVWIKINDPALALAFKGIGREKLPTLLRGIGVFTRFYAGLATRFNPEFALPNKIRDLQETMIYMAAQKDVGFKGAAKLMTKDLGSVKAVWDSIRGVPSAGAKMYEEMKALGGTTGGFGLSTRKQTELDLDRMIETAASRPKQAAADVIKYIDNWNTVFEDSTRLSVYKQALSQGASKERAAFLAKEASINFNRMGRGGPVINAIWMFSNASIQGSVKMVRSLKNPKVAAAVTATVAAAVGATSEWNDHVDPDWRNKVTKWDQLNGLPVMLPSTKEGGARYFVIPVSWGVKPIKIMADYAYSAANGMEVDLARAASDLFTSVADAYNPLGGTDAVSALTPSVLDVPVEIVRNQSWSGSKIRPDFDKNAPKDIQYFSNLNETASGGAFINLTKDLQKYVGVALSPADMEYAFESYIGGAGKAALKTGNSALNLTKGKTPPADEFPFISRFYRSRTQEELGQGAGGDTETIKGILQNQSRAQFYDKQGAEDKWKEFSALPKEQAKQAFLDLSKSDPKLAQKVLQISKQESKGLTYTDRLITQLGVENGERALYLYSKFDALTSKEDKQALWKDYMAKGIISTAVAQQLNYLLSHPPKEMSNKQSNSGGGLVKVIAALTGAHKAEAAEMSQAPKAHYIRDNAISDQDLEEAKAILFGEVSNRSPQKQQLEAQTILNTAFNRMDEYRKHGQQKTLAEVLQMPNQYQAYKGKEYARFKAGKTRPTDEAKLIAIEAMLAKVKDGSFENNIGDYKFYSHKPDGRIVAVNKPLFSP